MYCENCGNPLLPTDKFCDKCGAKNRLAGETVPVQPKKRKLWPLILAVVLVILLGLAALVALDVVELPFGDGSHSTADDREDEDSEDEEPEEEETEETAPTATTEVPATAPQEPVSATELPTEATEPVAMVQDPYTEYDWDSMNLRSLSSGEQREINIFLSNFSEVWFHEYDLHTFEVGYDVFDTAEAEDSQLINFVFNHLLVNGFSVLSQTSDGSEVYLSLSKINTYTQRFFGRNVTLEGFVLPNYQVSSDKVYRTWGSGDTYNHMTVAEEMWLQADGTYVVKFRIYAAGVAYDAGPGSIGDSSIYYLTPEQARTDPGVTYYRSGIAVVKPYRHNGRDSYQLISYRLVDPMVQAVLEGAE